MWQSSRAGDRNLGTHRLRIAVIFLIKGPAAPQAWMPQVSGAALSTVTLLACPSLLPCYPQRKGKASGSRSTNLRDLVGSQRAGRGRDRCTGLTHSQALFCCRPWRGHLGPNIQQGHPPQPQIGRQAGGDTPAFHSRRIRTRPHLPPIISWDAGADPTPVPKAQPPF